MVMMTVKADNELLQVSNKAAPPPPPPVELNLAFQQRPHDQAGDKDDDDDDDVAMISDCERASQSNTNKEEYEDEDHHQKSINQLAMSKREQSRIRTFRFMVVGMLLMTAAVTVMAYVLLGREETKNFETAYGQFARTLADAAVDHQHNLRNSMKSIANEMTAYAQMSNLTWPFVQLPLFESFALGYFDHSHGEFMGVNNYVTHDQRDAFTNWTAEHHEDWVKESHMIRYGNLDLLDQDPANFHTDIMKDGEDTFLVDDERPYYFVRAGGQSPPMRAYGPMINLNIASIATNEVSMASVVVMKSETVVTRAKPFTALPPDEHANFHTDSEADNPHSFLFGPVFEKVHDPSSKIVATITSSVAWDASMQHLLPSNVKGILCVIRNNCDQSFTYKVSGKDAFFLGDGDHHDDKFDHLEMEVDLAIYSHPDYPTAPGNCMYTMHIFPTDEFREEYETNMPLTFALVVFSTFALVAIVFFVYDWLVQRRNEELVQKAARSDMVVASLYPGEMKDKVLAQQDLALLSKKKKNNFYFNNNNNNNTDIDMVEQVQSGGSSSSPLAQEYQSTTIFFGDLSGFTKWSATRTPEQVFELLETIYTEFDKIAKRRRIFKIETIGDCYVAATGLPNPQPDHAVRMARFANDCMQSMNTLTTELALTLGIETATLKLRVGLHSGKITGGILKGDKRRFQLFGDTMNTASRMESNGVPGRIHISQATADGLIAHGKEHWLVPREEQVTAKGKGLMTTYFVVIPVSATGTVTNSSVDEMVAANGASTFEELIITESSNAAAFEEC